MKDPLFYMSAFSRKEIFFKKDLNQFAAGEEVFGWGTAEHFEQCPCFRNKRRRPRLNPKEMIPLKNVKIWLPMLRKHQSWKRAAKNCIVPWNYVLFRRFELRRNFKSTHFLAHGFVPIPMVYWFLFHFSTKQKV